MSILLKDLKSVLRESLTLQLHDARHHTLQKNLLVRNPG